MPNEATWRAEARTFAAYLGSPQIAAEVVERYRRAVEDWRLPNPLFDRWLRRLAAVHPVLTSLADAYARVVRPYGDLRRRLTLMLALLESHGATHARYDRARPASSTTTWVALAAVAVLWGASTLVAFMLLAPLHLLASLSRSR
ncbi:MAG: hypothetical protein ACT4P6_16110 [Gemmatimonadaceae bacterium]